MENQEKKPKALMPKRVQIVALMVGIPLLLYVSWDFATRLGWIGGPPKAKPVEVAVKPHTGETSAPKPSAPSGGTRPAPPRVASTGEAPDLDSIAAPSTDPMADLGVSTPETPTDGAPATDQPSTTAPTPPPIPPSGVPPLPPPMSTPASDTGFPSPTTGEEGPAGVAAPRVAPWAPRALSVGYPMARRGTRASSKPAPVALLGTISGSRGALAVVHRTDGDGEAARAQYVRPGEQLAGGTHRIESIEAGKIRIGGRGGPRELTVRRRSPSMGDKGSSSSPFKASTAGSPAEASAPTSDEAPAVPAETTADVLSNTGPAPE